MAVFSTGHGCVDAGPGFLRRTRPSARWSTSCRSLRTFFLLLPSSGKPPSASAESRNQRQAPGITRELNRKRARHRGGHRQANAGQGPTSAARMGFLIEAVQPFDLQELPSSGQALFCPCPDTKLPPPHPQGRLARLQALDTRFPGVHTEGCQHRSGLGRGQQAPLKCWPLLRLV